MKNLFSFQLQEIKAAQSDNHIANLVSIIEDLDKQITLWRECSECDTPEEVKGKIAGLDAAVTALTP